MPKTKKVKPEVQPTDQQNADKFLDGYKALCDKYQMRLVVTPAFKSRDDGTFSVILQTAVGKLPKE